MPDRLFGLPAHPLLVHVPVVLLPVCVLLAILVVARPKLVGHYGIPLVVVSFVSAVGTFLAAEAGDGLEKILGEHSAALESHASWGDRTKIVAVLFFLLVAGFVVVARKANQATSDSKGKNPAVAVLALLVVLSGVASVACVVKTGHSGAKLAWEDAGKPGA